MTSLRGNLHSLHPTAPARCRRSRERHGEPRPTWFCSPITTPSRPSGAARRGGTATCCCSWAPRSRRARATTCLRSGSTARSTTRSSTQPGSAVPCATRLIGFAAHPFSRGSERFKRAARVPFDDWLRSLQGIELWSFVNDTGDARQRPRLVPSWPRRRGRSPPTPAQPGGLGTALPRAPARGPGGPRRPQSASESGALCRCV